MQNLEQQASANWKLVIIRWCLPLIAALQILYYFEARVSRHIHEDEVYWVGSTYYYNLAFIQHDLRHPDWQLLPARENPPLGKFIMGAAMHVSGRQIKSPDLLGSFYLYFANIPGAWGSGEAYNKRSQIAERVKPSIALAVLDGNKLSIDPSDLAVARRLMCLLAIAATIGLCLIGDECGSPAGGFFAALMFGVHPIVIPAYTAAMIDMVALCFSILFVLALLKLTNGQARTTRRHALLVIGTATLLALACGSKMNSLIVVGVACVCAAFYLLQTWRQKGDVSQARTERSRFVAVVISLVIALLVFVVANPTLYSNTLDGLVALVREHRLTAEIQETFVGRRLQTVSERWKVISVFVASDPLMITPILFAVGWQLVYSCFRRSNFVVIVLWWFVALGMLLAWMPFSWSRYALPLVPPTMLVMGMTLSDLARGAIAFVRNRIPGPATVK